MTDNESSSEGIVDLLNQDHERQETDIYSHLKNIAKRIADRSIVCFGGKNIEIPYNEAIEKTRVTPHLFQLYHLLQGLDHTAASGECLQQLQQIKSITNARLMARFSGGCCAYFYYRARATSFYEEINDFMQSEMVVDLMQRLEHRAKAVDGSVTEVRVDTPPRSPRCA